MQDGTQNNTAKEKMEVIFSFREFLSHVALSTMLLLTVLFSFIVDVAYDRSNNQNFRVLSYYIKLPVFFMTFVSTINICLIILGLSEVKREQLEILVSNLGQLQIRHHLSSWVSEKTDESHSSDQSNSGHESEYRKRQQLTQDRIKSAYKEHYPLSSSE